MKKVILSLFATLGVFSASCSAQADGIKVLNPQVFFSQATADTSAVILDVRTPSEYAESHLSGASQLDYLNKEIFDDGIKKLDKAHTYYVYCRSGRRSHAACEKMIKMGLRVYDMEGGILNWQKKKMPVVK